MRRQSNNLGIQDQKIENSKQIDMGYGQIKSFLQDKIKNMVVKKKQDGFQFDIM